MLNPWYISGFVDGEGCFCLAINTENRVRKVKISVYHYWIADFSIHLRLDDAQILNEIRDYLQAGRVNTILKQNAVHFNVRDRKDLTSKIIPHFDQYPLQAKKQSDYSLWREAVIILETAKLRKTSAFSGQMLTTEEEQRLYAIRECLTNRLSDSRRAIFQSSRAGLLTGKEIKL